MLRNRRIIPKNNIWLPLEIAGLNLWIDFGDPSTLYTDDGTTLVVNDNDPIYMARDKSGNNKHVKNVNDVNNPDNPAYRPLYKTNVKNGLSVARFDADDDRLMISPTATNFIDLLVGSTMFFISQTSSASFPRGVLGADGKANNQWRYANATTLAFATTGSPGMNYNLTCVAANYSIFTYTVQPKPKLLQGWVNGANSPGVIDTDWTATNSFITMCGDGYNYTNNLGGDICEWIFYNRPLYDNERCKVRDYLNRKWNIY